MTAKKVLFFTNTLPEYRIPLYQLLSEEYSIEFIFTRMSLAEEIYGNALDEKKLDKIAIKNITNGYTVTDFIRSLIDINHGQESGNH